IRDRDILPRFKSGDLSGGIRAGVERMAMIIAREHGVTLSGAPQAPRRAPTSRTPMMILRLLILFFVVLPVVMSSLQDPRTRRRWGGPMGGGPLWGASFGGGGFGGHGRRGFGRFGGGRFGGGAAGGKW